MFLGQRGDEGPWTVRDRELAQALALYEASLCEGCGHSLSETLDPDREGWYLVEVDTCAACRARDLELKDGEPEPGAQVRVLADPDYEKRS